MKKETGIILLLVGFVVGFGIGLMTSSSLRPAPAAPVSTSAQTPGAPPMTTGSPESYASSQQADAKAAEIARLQEEIKKIKMALDTDPENLNALVALGNSYFDIGQHYASIDAYKKALTLNPNMPNVLVDLGIMYRQIEKFDEAIAHVNKALEINPKHAPSYLNRAVMLEYDFGDFQAALDSYNKFLELTTDHPMIPNAKSEISFLTAELGKGNKGPGKREPESHEGHNHPPGEGH